MKAVEEKIIEQVASKVHSVWIKWLKYMFNNGVFNRDGSFTIPKLLVDRWTKQMNDKYGDLTEQEKKSDRSIAKSYISSMRNIIDKEYR